MRSTGALVHVAKGTPDEDFHFGSRLYIEDDDGTLRLRELESWHEARTFSGQASLSASAFSATGSRVAVSVSGQTTVLDPRRGSGRAHAQPIPGRSTPLLSLPTDVNCCMAARTPQSCCVTSKAELPFAPSRVMSSSVKSVLFSSDARRLVSGDDGGTVKVWKLATGKLLNTLKGNERSADSVAFSPDGRKALAGTNDNKVRIWDLASGREVKRRCANVDRSGHRHGHIAGWPARGGRSLFAAADQAVGHRERQGAAPVGERLRRAICHSRRCQVLHRGRSRACRRARTTL